VFSPIPHSSLLIPHWRLRCLCPVVVFLGILFGCAQPAEEDPLPFSAWFPIRLGEETIEVQVAHLPREISRGLMYRTSLGEDRGMLFLYDAPKAMSFWMRNTSIALDIGFFTADGVLREIYPMYPMDERAVKSRREDLVMALEMNQGWYAKNGVGVGAELELTTLRKWLLQRGVESSRIPF